MELVDKIYEAVYTTVYQAALTIISDRMEDGDWDGGEDFPEEMRRYIQDEGLGDAVANTASYAALDAVEHLEGIE